MGTQPGKEGPTVGSVGGDIVAAPLMARPPMGPPPQAAPHRHGSQVTRRDTVVAHAPAVKPCHSG